MDRKVILFQKLKDMVVDQEHSEEDWKDLKEDLVNLM